MISCCLHPITFQKSLFETYSPIIIPIIAFGLGLLAFRLNEEWKEKERLRNIRECIIIHLRKSILPDLPILSEAYAGCKLKVGKFNNSLEKTYAFESFNDDLYRAHLPSDYYKIFYSETNNKFNDIISIYSIIKFLASSLPSQNYNMYVETIDKHLEEHTKSSETRQEHFEKCWVCKVTNARYLILFDMRIEEVKKLEKAIKDFIS